MNLLFLETFKLLIALVFLIARLLDIDKKFSQCISESVDILIKLGMDFLFLRKLRDNKTAR